VARAVHDEFVQVAAAARLVLDQAHGGPGGPASDEWYARLCDLLEHIRRNGVLVWHELRFGHLGQRDSASCPATAATASCCAATAALPAGSHFRRWRCAGCWARRLCSGAAAMAA
jgi:hypothetical protein